MNHLTTNSAVALVEHIYAFIDSKLQFINYEIDSAVKTFQVHDSVSMIRHKELSSPSATSNRFEEVLASIENHSKTKGKLLLLRSKLGSHNAQLAFDLLTDNKYMFYSEKRLISMLDKVVP